MSTIDLEALAAELRAAGFDAKVKINTRDEPYIVSLPFGIHSDGMITGPMLWHEREWRSLDIIRRHLSPPAQRFTEAEREAILLGIAGIDYAHDVPNFIRSFQDRDFQKAMATLRAMLDAAPPTVDVDALMRMIVEYGVSREDAGWYRARQDDDQAKKAEALNGERYAAIRAALEGTR